MSIFPFVQPTTTTATVTEPYSDVKWDFENNKPVFVRGEPVIVTGAEAIKSWAWRALHTERFLNEIYSWDYGNEAMSLIGQEWSAETKTAEAVRYIEECLTVNPYIKGINNAKVTFDGTVLTLSCNIEYIEGEITTSTSTTTNEAYLTASNGSDYVFITCRLG